MKRGKTKNGYVSWISFYKQPLSANGRLFVHVCRRSGTQIAGGNRFAI